MLNSIIMLLMILAIVGIIVLAKTIKNNQIILILSHSYLLIIPFSYFTLSFTSIDTLSQLFFAWGIMIFSGLFFLIYNIKTIDKNYLSLFGKWIINSSIFVIFSTLSYMAMYYFFGKSHIYLGDMAGLEIIIIIPSLIIFVIIVLISKIIFKVIKDKNSKA